MNILQVDIDRGGPLHVREHTCSRSYRQHYYVNEWDECMSIQLDLHHSWSWGDPSPPESQTCDMHETLYVLYCQVSRHFLISGLLRSLLVSFWVGRLTANLVIAFETFKRLHNLKAWLPLTSMCRKNFLTSYCIHSVVALWSWEIQILCVIRSLAIYFGIFDYG